MKRRFEYMGKTYKVRKESGERMSHARTDDLLRTLLHTPDACYSMTGDTMVVVTDGVAYIGTIRESIILEDE
jgi:hypothetical protein